MVIIIWDKPDMVMQRSQKSIGALFTPPPRYPVRFALSEDGKIERYVNERFGYL